MIDLVPPPESAPEPVAEPAGRLSMSELGAEADAATAELAHRLTVVQAAYGLRRDHLVAAGRDARRLSSIDAVPSSREFWDRTAWPRADALVGESLREISVAARRVQSAGADCRGSAEEVAAVIDRAVRSMADLLPGRHPIEEMGRWWEQRLRWTAAAKAIPDILVAPVERIPDRIAASELALSGQAPWRCEDQLLAAFEAAHRIIDDRGLALLGAIERP